MFCVPTNLRKINSCTPQNQFKKKKSNSYPRFTNEPCPRFTNKLQWHRELLVQEESLNRLVHQILFSNLVSLGFRQQSDISCPFLSYLLSCSIPLNSFILSWLFPPTPSCPLLSTCWISRGLQPFPAPPNLPFSSCLDVKATPGRSISAVHLFPSPSPPLSYAWACQLPYHCSSLTSAPQSPSVFPFLYVAPIGPWLAHRFCQALLFACSAAPLFISS